MLERIYENLYSYPEDARQIGAFLQWISFVFFLVGLLSNVLVQATSLMQGLILKNGKTESSMAQLMPSIPTWWIPESVPALALIALLGIAGVFM